MIQHCGWGIRLENVNCAKKKTTVSPATHDGFTLIETLIALVILAVVVVTVYQSLSSGLKATGRSNPKIFNALEARSILDQVGGPVGLEPTEIDREVPGSPHWVLRTEVVPNPFGLQAKNSEYILYHIKITQISRFGRPQSFETMRIGLAKD